MTIIWTGKIKIMTILMYFYQHVGTCLLILNSLFRPVLITLPDFKYGAILSTIFF